MAEPSAYAQPPQADAVVVTAWAAAPRGAGTGGAGGAEWLRSVGSASGIQLGGQSGSLAGSWWIFGRVGGFTRRGTLVFIGTVDVGRAHAGATAPYWRYSAGASKALRSTRFLVDGEFQQFKLDLVEQRLLRLGASVPLGKSVDFKTSYFIIAAAGTRTPAVSSRVDLAIDKRRVLMGVVLSRSSVAQPLIGYGNVIRTSQQWFAGFSTPVGATTLVAAANLMRSDSSRMVRLEIGLRVPLPQKRIAATPTPPPPD